MPVANEHARTHEQLANRNSMKETFVFFRAIKMPYAL